VSAALRPFFSYYGAKHRIAKLYPAPRYPRIIEPFCGSAGYATRHSDRDVTLADVDERIVGIWRFLTSATRDDIMSLPAIFGHIDDVKAPQEAKWFLGFWIVRGAASPRRKPSKWMQSGKYESSLWSATVRARIAAQVERIRHWRVQHASYDALPDAEATWFIDAPYEGPAGRHYRRGLPLEYADLGEWCRLRSGQVIVCEAAGAKWLPFEYIKSTTTINNRGARLRRRKEAREAMWCSDPGDAGQRSFIGRNSAGNNVSNVKADGSRSDVQVLWRE